MTNKTNPLANHFRQPKLYMKLPSGGLFNTDKDLDFPENKEIAIFPMTAKDEIRFKTPDALMNGQGVVDVIQSCVPEIKDAWQIKSHDLDTILIAIRIATYGETMDINFTNKNCNLW